MPARPLRDLVALLPRSAVVERLRASLWFLPTIAVAAASALAVVLNRVDVEDATWLEGAVFPGGPDSARSILQTIAGSVITVTGVVFSLTVVTLQLASTQYSPRLLRTFLRDVSNQVVLGTFLATFAYCLIVLRGVASEASLETPSVPAAAVTGAFVMAAASVVALVYFIDHIARAIRIDSLMREVNEDTTEAIRHLAQTTTMAAPEARPRDAVAVAAGRSGFVQSVRDHKLAAAAAEHGAVVHLAARIGELVIEDAPLAWVELEGGGERVPDGLARAVHRFVRIGYERTMQQDVAFGLRQLVDVAVKALSPGINDPTTAVHAMGHLTHLLVRLARGDLGDRVTCDDGGELRLVVPGTAFPEHLDHVCGQIRRYGAAEPAVTIGLLRLVRDLARADHPGRHADAIRRETELVLAAAARETAEPRDLEPLGDLRREIEEIVAEAEARG